MNERSLQKPGTKSAMVAEVKAQATILGGFAGLLWLVQLVNAIVFHGALVAFGVHPRTLAGLAGILFAPLLHASFAHLLANTIPLVVLGWLVMLRQKRDLLTVSLLAALVGGLGTWLIAPALSVHVGASVLVFGYLGYLLARGVFERRFWPIVGSVLVLFLYGGALSGVLPGQLGISWQGHLFGLLGGVLAARLLKERHVVAAIPPRAARLRVAPSGAREAASEADEEADEEAELEAELGRAREAVRARAAR